MAGGVHMSTSTIWTRREFVRTGLTSGSILIGAGLLETLVSCAGQSSVAPASGQPKGQLEIFSWWTAGGEADGLAELLKVYGKKYPDVTVKNAAVAGGAGSNAK